MHFIAILLWGAMSNLGFLQLSRSFYKDPLWLGLSPEYRSIFMTILINCAWKETELDDFGVKIVVKPGQLLMTERSIISEAFPPTTDEKILDKYKACYRRAISKFEKLGFSYHKTYHKKTLHTIIREDILQCFVPTIVPNSYQTRTIKEEYNNKIQQQPNACVVSSTSKKTKKQALIDDILEKHCDVFDSAFLGSLIRRFSIKATSIAMDEYEQVKIKTNPRGLLTSLAKNHHVEMKENECKFANQ